MSDILEYAKEFGWPITIGVFGVALAGKALWNQKSLVTREQLDEELDKVHENCHFPRGAMEAVKKDVEDLKVENAEFRAYMKSFFQYIDNIDKRFDKLENKLDDLFNLHLEK